jgi:hypothetical protein
MHEMRWSKFETSYMWNNDYHLRRTRFATYQLAMLLCVVSESLGTAALSGESSHVLMADTRQNVTNVSRLPPPALLHRHALTWRNSTPSCLHRHHIIQHRGRRLCRNHLRKCLLLRPLLARADRVVRRQACVATFLRSCVCADARVCTGVDVGCRDAARVCHRCGRLHYSTLVAWV